MISGAHTESVEHSKSELLPTRACHTRPRFWGNFTHSSAGTTDRCRSARVVAWRAPTALLQNKENNRAWVSGRLLPTDQLVRSARWCQWASVLTFNEPLSGMPAC